MSQRLRHCLSWGCHWGGWWWHDDDRTVFHLYGWTLKEYTWKIDREEVSIFKSMQTVTHTENVPSCHFFCRVCYLSQFHFQFDTSSHLLGSLLSHFAFDLLLVNFLLFLPLFLCHLFPTGCSPQTNSCIIVSDKSSLHPCSLNQDCFDCWMLLIKDQSDAVILICKSTVLGKWLLC